MNIQWHQASLLGLFFLIAGCGDRSMTTASAPIVAIEPEAAAKPPEATDVADSEAPLIPETGQSVQEQTVQAGMQAVQPNQTHQAAELPLPPANETLIPVPVLPPPPPLLPVPAQAVQRQQTAASSRPAQPTQPTSAGTSNRAAVRSPQPSAPANPAPAAATPTSSPQPPVTRSAPATPPTNPSAPDDLANQIAVSGVIQIGGQTSAIIEVPNEATSRYVSVGDNLANGRVEVKRIEVGANQDPVVVLEQDGVEVYRPVGQ